MRTRSLCLLAALVAAALPARAQWAPASGEWLKSDARDLRVMTWNVEDGLCSSNPKLEGANSWTALARVVAALQPDVLILQECGDNTGNRTGGGVDSVKNLTRVMDLFLHGGVDGFRAESPVVTSYVQAFAPDYDLPFVFVSGNSDGFNRDVILSRFPFKDLNGDGVALHSDMPKLSPDAYAPGPDGGVRGLQLAEIDLPDALYRGDLVIGNVHLKAGSKSADHAKRIAAAQNIAYFLEHLLEGAGTGVPDPKGRFADQPPVTRVLDAHTLVILGGDLNEDEQANGEVKGPIDWITQAEFADATGARDGPDRDRSDLSCDDARDVFTRSRATRGKAKLDALIWQDSVATQRRAFVFDAANVPAEALPPALVAWPSASAASALAADHRPVVLDLILPRALEPSAEPIRQSGTER